MNTNEQTVGMVRRRRRSYSEDFKADAVAACLQPGDVDGRCSTVSRPERQLTAALGVEAERTGSGRVSARSASVESGSRFVPVPLASALAEPMIRIELRSSSGTVIVQWPMAAASECAALLRELTR